MDQAPRTPESKLHRAGWTEALVLAVAFILVNFAAALTQKPFPFHDREGWEGAAYLEMARQVAVGHFPITDDAPEVFRLGGPFLAGLVDRATGWDLLTCFRLVNGLANALSLGLLVVWLRRFLQDWRVRLALALIFLVQWDAPTRWLYFFPPHTDPWMWVFMLAGLLAADRCRERLTPGKIALVTALTVVGVCFREIVLAVGLIMPFTANPLRWGTPRERWRDVPPRLIPLAAGVVTMAALRLVARRENTYTFAWTALHYVYEKPWPVYLLCWFLAFGPILWLAIFRARESTAFLAGRQHLAVYVLIFATLADMGGSDTERFLYWTMPVIYILVGRALEDTRPAWPGWLLTTLAGMQLLAARAIFWPAVPPYPNRIAHPWPILTPFGRNVPFDDLYTDTAPKLLSFIYLLEYLALGAALGIWLLWQHQRRPAALPADARLEDTRIGSKLG